MIGPNPTADRPTWRNVAFLGAFALLLFVVFALLATAVAPPSVPGRWDEPMRQAFADADDQMPELHRASALLTHLAGRYFLLTLSTIVAVVIGLRGQWRFALIWLALICLGLLAIEGVKHLVGRPRPPGDLTIGMSPSFPSGHAGGVMLTGAMLAYIFSRSKFGLGRAAALVAVLLAFPLGLTRIILGVHWLSDVFGGWLFGMGWALLGIAFLEAWQGINRQRPDATSSQATAPSR